MRENFSYMGEHQSCISFPLGGIGSGCIGLGGNGRLQDWEIFNRPAKGSYNGFSHFAIKAEDESRVLDARILNGDLQPPYTGPLGCENFYEGFGFGTLRQTMAGMPHFAANTFRGTFPIARLTFADEKFPGTVAIEAFNPLIPHEADNSSIPAAFFEFTIQNTEPRPLAYYLVGVLGNPYQGTVRNRFGRQGGLSLMRLDSLDAPDSDRGCDIAAGELCLATDAEDVSFQEYLFRSQWFDALEIYWRDMLRFGPFSNRQYAPRYQAKDAPRRDNALLAARLRLAPGENRSVRFVIAWYHPHNRNTWATLHQEKRDAALWKNYYATLWPNVQSVAAHALHHWDELYRATEEFRTALFASSVSEAVIDAVSANISVLKSPTVWRLEDGTLYGWEGAGEKEGSCSHVWAYAQALPALFPALSRSMREAEYACNWAEDGSMSFRLMLPLKKQPEDNKGAKGRWPFRPAADGQFATIMQTFREWRNLGDDEWLRPLWPKVKAALEFAWSAANEGLWDPQKTGILWGRQHHTLDMELYGPNPWLSGMYLGALQAGAQMAQAMGEPDVAAEYRRIFAAGKVFLNKKLFNGKYFIQQIDLHERDLLLPYAKQADSCLWVHGKDSILDVYWSEEFGELKYQIGDGVATDQLLGQWHADLYGLGEIFAPQKLQSALSAIFRHNFRTAMRGHYNPCRIYSLNDEAGLVICSWPKNKPVIPLPYSQETMCGFEYAAAALMLRHGLEEAGLKIAAAVRARYDGRRRNPWNEVECGSNYARSMASYSLLQSLSGIDYDGRCARFSFCPLKLRDCRFFWSCGSAWGSVTLNSATLNGVEGAAPERTPKAQASQTKSQTKTWSMRLLLQGGRLRLRSLTLKEPRFPASLTRNGESLQFRCISQTIELEAPLVLQRGDSLVVGP